MLLTKIFNTFNTTKTYPLTKINLFHTKVSDSQFIKLLEVCPHLTDILYSRINDVKIQAIIQYCSNVKTIDSSTNVSDFSHMTNNIMTNESLSRLSACTQLHTL